MDKCPQDKCCLDKYRGDSCNLFYMFPGLFVQSLIKIGPVTAEILLSKSLCGGWVVVCKPILVFSLSLGQAEQKKRKCASNWLKPQNLQFQILCPHHIFVHNFFNLSLKKNIVIFGFCKGWAVKKCTEPQSKIIWKPRN